MLRLWVFEQKVCIVTKRSLTSSVSSFHILADWCNPCLITDLKRPDILAACDYFTVTHLCLSVGADDL